MKYYNDNQEQKEITHISQTCDVTVKGNYDIIVVGGGIAGISAAISARRNNKKVLLIEKTITLGGLATAGLIHIYLPLCDGKGKALIGGIAEELLQLSIKNGYHSYDPQWKEKKQRYETVFSPPEFQLALDRLVVEEGVDLLLDTLFCDTVCVDNKVEAVIVENKSGREAYYTQYVVDATGDADVFYHCDAPCKEQDNWLSYWAFHTTLQSFKEAVANHDIKKGIVLKNYGLGANGSGPIKGTRKYKGTDAKEITEFVLEGRKLVLNSIEQVKDESYNMLMLPSIPQFRTTRRIVGKTTVLESEQNQYCKDSIGCIGEWRAKHIGVYYEIPYYALIDQKLKNVISAGRIISAEGEAWEATRVIPVAAMTGHVAGTTLAMCMDKNLPVQQIDIKSLQKQLASEGIRIHYS